MSAAPPVLRTLAVSKSYGKRLAVDRLDLEIGHAELFGFLGPNGAGKTVFISSDVLSEVQQICTRVAIINHGKLIRVATVSDLVQASGEYEVKVDSPVELLAALRLQAWASNARAEDGYVVTSAPEGRGRDLIKFLVENGHNPDSVSPRHRDLEDIFLSLTAEEKR